MARLNEQLANGFPGLRAISWDCRAALTISAYTAMDECDYPSQLDGSSDVKLLSRSQVRKRTLVIGSLRVPHLSAHDHARATVVNGIQHGSSMPIVSDICHPNRW